MTQYKQAKNCLKELANDVKTAYKDDKPLIRMVINNGIDTYVSHFKLTDYQRNLLSNYACKLHPKD